MNESSQFPHLALDEATAAVVGERAHKKYHKNMFKHGSSRESSQSDIYTINVFWRIKYQLETVYRMEHCMGVPTMFILTIPNAIVREDSLKQQYRVILWNFSHFFIGIESIEGGFLCKTSLLLRSKFYISTCSTQMAFE